MAFSSEAKKAHDMTTFPLSPILASCENQPVPLARIFACGGLRIELLHQPAASPEQAHYLPLDLQGQGKGPALLLLKHLLSAPNHYRLCDWLSEHWYGNDEERLPTRMDNRASLLRGLLCPPFLQGEARDRCRKQVLSLVEGSVASGNGYRLGAYPLLWIDIDALDWNVEQACQRERRGEDTLPLWERAYVLASAGSYLPEEEYSDWAEPPRQAVRGALRQSVHALKRLYLTRDGERGLEEMQRLLRTYLLHVPTDEDALRALLELLCQQQRFQEAREWLERAQRVYAEEGMTLDRPLLDERTLLHAPSCSCQQGLAEAERPGKRNTSEQEYWSSSLQQIIAAGVAEGLAQVFRREALPLEKNQTTRRISDAASHPLSRRSK